MWQSITSGSIPNPPPPPPINPDAGDLTVIANTLAQWQNYVQALTNVLNSLNSDTNYVSLLAKMQQADKLNNGIVVGGFHGWIDGSGTPFYDSESNQEWETAMNQIAQQQQLITQIQGELTSAVSTANRLQSQYSQFSNTGAGAQEESTLTANADTALAAQQAATVAATDSSNTKMIVIIAIVVLIAATVIYLGIRYFKKKNKKDAAK
jgi:uncharacterized phage infection (PIP) family protein YhgE